MEELHSLADALEYEFTVAALHDREDYAGLLRVGFQGLIEAADEIGLAPHATRSSAARSRTREHWDAAIADQRPGRRWDDSLGSVHLISPTSSRSNSRASCAT